MLPERAFLDPAMYAAAAVANAQGGDSSNRKEATTGNCSALFRAVVFILGNPFNREVFQMIVKQIEADGLRQQWRRQILAHRDPQAVAARKGFVAMTFVNQASSASAFVDINNLLVIALYEDDFYSGENPSSRRVPLRLSGHEVSRVANGVQWGGATNSRLFKDLMLTPQHDARGQRIDRGKGDWLSLALKLDCRISRAARHPAAPWPGLRLPRLWAGFPSRGIRTLRAEGPEFERSCRNRSGAASALFLESARHMDGLTLYPLEWVSNQLHCATAVFAELIPSLRRQVFRISRLPDGLIGYRGASAFDFYNSRFRRLPSDRSASRGAGYSTAVDPQNAAIETQLMQSGSLVA